jgi:AcrR family transcriptional regulator
MSNAEPGSLDRAAARSVAARSKKRTRRTQAERSEDTRRRVIEGAVKVLREKGYAAFRTQEVERVSKVSRGAQQHHFPTKDSLVLATAAHLLREGLDRGRARAEAARNEADVIEAIIQDAIEFFLGPEFITILDLVIAGSKDKSLRDKVYAYSRESRLAVEAEWMEVLCERGVPRQTAETILWLTISIIRGFSVRALWQRDEALFRRLIDEWKQMVFTQVKELRRVQG